MSFLISLLLPFLICLVLALSSTALWWSSLQNPWPFFIVGFLGLLGIHRVIQIAIEVLKLFWGSGYFLEIRAAPSAMELVQENLTIETFATSAVLVALGIPLLLWLKQALSAQ